MYRKKKSGIIKHIDFLIIDILLIEVSLFVSYLLRNGWGFQNYEFERIYKDVALLLILFSVIVSVGMNSYISIRERGYYIEFLYTAKHVLAVALLLLVYLYVTQTSYYYSRTVFTLTFIIDIFLSYIVRNLWKFMLNKGIMYTNDSLRTMMLITTSDKVKNLLNDLIVKRHIDYKSGGIIIIDKDMTGEAICGIPVVAGADNALEYICRNWVDEVFVDMDNEYSEMEHKITESCLIMGITVHQALARNISQPGKVQVVEKIGRYTVLSSAINTITMREMVLKRILDIIGGLVGVIFTGIIFVFIAPAIYIKSPGPVFFKQWRVGRNGKKFQIYKFRSMYLDAEERKAELMNQNKVKDGMMFKIDNDPRIIGGENGKGIGNFIRNTSLDEFPQFLNVLKGDMSLVGTRPPTLDEWEKYELHHRARLAIKPGLTGMWQVSGRSNITDFEEIVKLDTEYIMNWSIGKDIKILFKTVLVVLRREGSS